MNIVRAPRKRGFVIIPNKAIEDTRLSYKARGLLAYLLSRPDGWRTDSVRLAALAPDGRDAVRTGLQELERAGYLHRDKRQNDAGQWVTESQISDEPRTDYPASGEPTPDEPAVGGPGANELRSKTESKNDPARGETHDGAPLGCASHRDRRRTSCDACTRVLLPPRDTVAPATRDAVEAARIALGRAQ